MEPKPANKHEQRTKETRDLLLQAAETIFVRDGYEGAELGEIAALAGRTKGAIYAQFKSKEDIFLALIQVNRQRYREEMRSRLAQSSTVEGNIAAMREFFEGRVKDSNWPLLLLEFKLFAIRHPEAQVRLQSLMAEFLSPEDKERVETILGPAGDGPDAVPRLTAVQALQPMISALALETRFAPTMLGVEEAQKVFRLTFDAVMGVRAEGSGLGAGGGVSGAEGGEG